MQINPDLSLREHKAILLEKAIARDIDFDTYYNEVKELEEHFLRPPTVIEILEDLVACTEEHGFS